MATPQDKSEVDRLAASSTPIAAKPMPKLGSGKKVITQKDADAFNEGMEAWRKTLTSASSSTTVVQAQATPTPTTPTQQIIQQITQQTTQVEVIDPIGSGISKCVWLGIRTDGSAGKGTHSNPFDASTPERFDALMRGFPINTRINLLPGDYYSRGGLEYHPETGIFFKTGWKIHGSGMGVTVIHLVPEAFAYHDKLCWIAPPPSYGLADYVEVSDLTIDCAYSSTALDGSCVMGLYCTGSHTNYRRVEVINFGAKWGESFPLAMAPGRNIQSAGHIIEQCRVHRPAYFAASGAYCTLVSVFGSLYAPELLPAPYNGIYAYMDVENYSRSAIIRDNYLDGTMPDGKSGPFQAILAAGAVASIVERNFVSSCFVGGPWQDTAPLMEIVARGNHFWNCGYSSCMMRSYRANWPNCKTRKVILENNIYHIAKVGAFNYQDPIGILLYGDNASYSWNPSTPNFPKEFYSTDYVRIANNYFGFVGNRFMLFDGNHVTTAGADPLPYSDPPPDPNGWQAAVSSDIWAMFISRVRDLQIVDNTFSTEFVNTKPIKVRGCQNVEVHGNRYLNGTVAPVHKYAADDGTYGKYDWPADAEWQMEYQDEAVRDRQRATAMALIL